MSAAGLAAYLHTGEATQLDPRFVEDISGGGAFIRTAAMLPLSTPVALILVRPGMKKAILKHELAGRDAQITALEAQLARARQVIATRDEHIKTLTQRRQRGPRPAFFRASSSLLSSAGASGITCPSGRAAARIFA